MSSNSSASTTPKPASAPIALPTTTRRRVADGVTDAASTVTLASSTNINNNNNVGKVDQEDVVVFSSDEDVESDPTGNGGGSHQHHNHHFAPVIKYLLLRRKVFFCVPEAWLLWAVSVRSGRNLGRKILVGLMLLAVVSVFFKFAFLGGHVEVGGDVVKRTEGTLLILKALQDDWAAAQRAVTENQEIRPKLVFERLSLSESESQSSVPKRLLDEQNTACRFL